MIKYLNMLDKNEFDCLEPKEHDCFYYTYKRKTCIIKCVEGYRICNDETGCCFRNKLDECGAFACRATERKDGRYVQFKKISKKEYDIIQIQKMMEEQG
jgi:hypothetical protein